MKKRINGRLCDTETARMLFCKNDIEYYRTKSGVFFSYNCINHRFSEITEEEVNSISGGENLLGAAVGASEKVITFCMSDDMVAMMDKKRGKMSRSAYIRKLIMEV